MKSNLRTAILSVGFLALVFLFQNCSVYQSSGRKYLEEEGLNLETSDISSKIIAKVEEDSCKQYLSPQTVDEWSGGISSVRSFAAIEEQELKCLYSIAENQNGVEHISCEISPSLVAAANFPKINQSELYSGNIGNITTEVSEDGLCMNLSPKLGLNGAKCCYQSSLNYEKLKEETLKLGIQILKELR